jgi:hypothetical protein
VTAQLAKWGGHLEVSLGVGCSPSPRKGALGPHAPGRKPAHEANVSRAAEAWRPGPPGDCVHPAPLCAAGAPPWCPDGTAARRRHPRPPPTGTGSGKAVGGSGQWWLRMTRWLGVAHLAPAYPEHRHILDPQLVTHVAALSGPCSGGALQVQEEPGGTKDSDVCHHGEGIPVRVGQSSAGHRNACGHFLPPSRPLSE